MDRDWITFANRMLTRTGGTCAIIAVLRADGHFEFATAWGPNKQQALSPLLRKLAQDIESTEPVAVP